MASLYWGYIGFSAQNYNYLIGLLQFLSDVALYILITHLYAQFRIKTQRWQQLNLGQFPAAYHPGDYYNGHSLSLLVTSYIKVYFFNKWISPGSTPPFLVFFKANRLTMFMAGIRLMSIWLLAYHLYHYAQREINITKEKRTS